MTYWYRCDDFFDVNLIKLYFTARFARDAKDTEGENFSFAAETPAKEKHSFLPGGKPRI